MPKQINWDNSLLVRRRRVGVAFGRGVGVIALPEAAGALPQAERVAVAPTAIT
ncbi:MAG TPA: hypothetical protein VG815_16835 [Chloroflexota bacterium]|nr:hypothetical protein [Chloroflexota bacterium]